MEYTSIVAPIGTDFRKLYLSDYTSIAPLLLLPPIYSQCFVFSTTCLLIIAWKVRLQRRSPVWWLPLPAMSLLLLLLLRRRQLTPAK